jgi:DNA-binding LytR/AlgR family response regulator
MKNGCDVLKTFGMKQTFPLPGKLAVMASSVEKKSATTNTSFSGDGTRLIRFEAKKENYCWVEPGKILFVTSADHYVKSLIQHETQKKWMIRHSTIKDLLGILNQGQFIRLNKFYMLNLDHFSHIDESEKILYLDDGYSISIPHRISPFMINILKD